MPFFNISYEITMPSNPESAFEYQEQVINVIQNQEYLPVRIWPNAIQEHGISIHQTAHGIEAVFITEAESNEDIRPQRMLLQSRISNTIGAPRDYGPHVRSQCSEIQPHMPISMIIQLRAQSDADSDELYAVFQTGKAYQIPGDSLISSLENPNHEIFSTEGITLLSEEETQTIQNFEPRRGGPNYALIWAPDGHYGGYQPGGKAEQFMALNLTPMGI